MEAKNPSRPLILIGIGTHQRNEMLKRALLSIAEIHLPPEALVKLVVCDNDEEPSAEQVFHEVQNQLPIESTYLHEPRKGLVYMRNRILEHSHKIDADYLVFIDDDEFLTKDWLVELYQTKLTHSADAVGGPVLVEGLDPNKPHSELTSFLVFNRIPTHRTGDELDELATGNLLLDLSFIRKHDIRFRIEFNLLGGEDIFFTTEMVRKGAKLVWSSEAVAYTDWPLERLNLEYALKIQTRIVQFQHLATQLRKGRWAATSKTLVLVYKHLSTIVNKKIHRKLSDFEGARRRVAVRAGLQVVFGGKLDFYKQTDGQ